MSSITINEIGNWAYWTEDEKAALKLANNNTIVGEKLVLENDFLKTWTIHLPPNEALPFHKHNKKYLLVALTEGKSISYKNDGSVKETIYSIGDTGYYDTLDEENYFIHNLINTGTSTLIFSTTEFKK